MESLIEYVIRQSVRELPEEKIEAVIQICMATKYPKVATEILAGIYVKPNVPETCPNPYRYAKEYDQVDCKLVSYCPINDRVDYTYRRIHSYYLYMIRNQDFLPEYIVDSKEREAAKTANRTWYNELCLEDRKQCESVLISSAPSDAEYLSDCSLEEWLR